MEVNKGVLSVNSENIFPIIKKWLYSEQDIFARELISNASDAIAKRKQILSEKGEEGSFSGSIFLEIDGSRNLLMIKDNGLGMDADEIDRYINQVAFSGATDFIEKYKENDTVIGHFGLGFYSAFMAASHVSIDSLSYKAGAQPVRWDGLADMSYEMRKGEKAEVGTCITLHLPEGSPYGEPERLKEIVKKYFEFFPIPIRLICTDSNTQEICAEPLNDTEPFWYQEPDRCSRQAYVDFYKKAFRSKLEPKLWIHLFNEELGVKGLVYFRSEAQFHESIDGTMKLYCKKVFISDDAKSLIPEFLFLQDGIIDYAKAPLMVSRNALREDENVEAVTRFITKQVAYKLYGTFILERAYYESIWEDLNPFLKFSCLKDKLLASYVEKFILFKNMAGKYVTLKEHLEDIAPDHPNVIYYIADAVQQAHYINTFRQAGVDALYMTHVVDQPLIKKQEMKNRTLRFHRIDSDFHEALKADLTEEEEAGLSEDTRQLTPVFQDIFGEQKMELKVGKLRTDRVSSVIVIDEEERRVRDTLELYETRGIDISAFQAQNDVLLLNKNSVLVRYLLQCDNEQERELLARQLYDLARLGQERLEAQEMADFIERSNDILCSMVANRIDTGAR